MLERSKNVGGRVLVCQTGSSRFGIPLEWVVAVQENDEGNAGREGSDRHIFRGKEISVFELGRWLGREKTGGRTSAILILGREEAESAVVVESPGEVMSGIVVHEWPELCRDMIEDTFSGVIIEQERLVLMIDPERLLLSISQEGGSSQGGGVL